jgi:hypothetical protein
LHIRPKGLHLYDNLLHLYDDLLHLLTKSPDVYDSLYLF